MRLVRQVLHDVGDIGIGGDRPGRAALGHSLVLNFVKLTVYKQPGECQAPSVFDTIVTYRSDRNFSIR
jgi:hypothetical protein